MVTISENAYGIVALCEEKARLQTQAENLNALARDVMVAFEQKMIEISLEQENVLNRMAACDRGIEELAKGCK